MSSGLRRWLPPLIGIAVFLVVLVGAGLVAADWVKRGTEMRALIEQIEVSESAMKQAQDAVTKAYDGFEGKAPLSEENQAALDELLKDAAAEGLRNVAQAHALVASVKAMPWHTEVIEAREAYLAHNRAWQSFLGAAAEDASEFGVRHPDINSTFDAAEPALRAAVPSPDVFDLVPRLDVIFAPQPVEDSGPSQQVGLLAAA